MIFQQYIQFFQKECQTRFQCTEFKSLYKPVPDEFDNRRLYDPQAIVIGSEYNYGGQRDNVTVKLSFNRLYHSPVHRICFVSYDVISMQVAKNDFEHAIPM